MRKWIGFICHLALIGFMTSFATFSDKSEEKVIQVPDFLKVENSLETVVENSIQPESINFAPVVFLKKDFLGFKETLAFKESQGSYNAINTLGYMGKYQFGANTLKLLGLYDVNKFMADAKLQEQLFNLNVARNKWILRREIKRYSGKRIRGTTITESGIIAAAHLAGAGNVKKYLHSYGKEDVADAYGSNISYYIRKFGGFDTSEVKAKHNPRI
ncbi:hypothetical protein [Allomuricauda sp. d1]|uniref:hypothetical protein n=1 Tax=Allomuricauda sp. d1 TaxID=3136725 RepID=UPI0031D4758B